VEQVREAILSTLETHGAELRGLDGQESITVAVDFLGGAALARRARVRRTLVVRVPMSDLAARLEGTLSPAEFRQRVHARQY
jgi:hypothetical protein